MSGSSADEGSGGGSPGDGASARWGDDLELPERVIVVPAAPAEPVAREEDAGDDTDEWRGPAVGDGDAADAGEWSGPPTEAMAAVRDEDVVETEAPSVVETGDDEALRVPPTEAATVRDDPDPDPPTEAMATSAWRDDPDPEPPAEVEPTAVIAPTPAAVPPPAWGEGTLEPAKRPGRDETDPGALRPSAPESVSVKRVPSRSRRVVSRIRAFIGLVLVVVLAGVGLAAAVGAAVLLVTLVVQRAFGS